MEAAQPAVYGKTPIRLGDRNWDAEVRGGLVALKGRLKYHKITGGGKRGLVTGFSRQSRFRMFRCIATLDWRKAGKGLFLTLTFPDQLCPVPACQRMRWLNEFFRRLEAHEGKKLSAIWRCEWVPRRSGKHKGKFLPHFHLLLFSVSFIQWQTIRRIWREVLGVPGYVRTDVRRMRSKRDHGVYVAKYCAKVPENISLVSVAYSRIDGRHWGYYRNKLLPRHPSLYFEDISLKSVLKLREIADRELAWYDLECDAGFALIGTLGERLAKKILDDLLTNEVPNG